jgi:uncharacterized protein YqhQ
MQDEMSVFVDAMIQKYKVGALVGEQYQKSKKIHQHICTSIIALIIIIILLVFAVLGCYTLYTVNRAKIVLYVCMVVAFFCIRSIIFKWI